MNGYGPGVEYKYVMPLWEVWFIVVDIVFILGMGVWTYFFVRSILRMKKANAKGNNAAPVDESEKVFGSDDFTEIKIDEEEKQ